MKSASGALIQMSELPPIEMREGPFSISREQVKRRIYIGFNVVGATSAASWMKGGRNWNHWYT